MLMVSSVVISFDDRLECLSPRSLGNGGGDVPFPGGVTDRRDLLDARELREGVRYGVSCGVGSDVAAGPLRYSSSVSQTAMLGSGRVGTLFRFFVSIEVPYLSCEASRHPPIRRGLVRAVSRQDGSE